MVLTDSLPVAPIYDNGPQAPKKRSWDALGSIPALSKRLQADEAYGWMGTWIYRHEEGLRIGRVYAVVVRRKKFAWKIVFSFMTAVMADTRSEWLRTNDHVRAGEVLGELRLDEIPAEAAITVAQSTPKAMGEPTQFETASQDAAG